MIGGSVEQSGKGNRAAFEVKSPEVGPAKAAEGEFFSSFGQDGIEDGGRGGRDGSKGSRRISVSEELIEVVEGAGGVAGTGGAFRSDKVAFVGGQAREGPDDIGITGPEIGLSAGVELIKESLAQIAGAVGLVKTGVNDRIGIGERGHALGVVDRIALIKDLGVEFAKGEAGLYGG